MRVVYALVAVLLLVAVPVIGISGLHLNFVFGVILPYSAISILLLGLTYRVVKWGKAPVPFHIPTVTGQQKSLPWIKSSSTESPTSTLGTIGRMVLEVLFFRSLFRNDRVELEKPRRLTYRAKRFLWLGGLAFHWSLLIILFRHSRLFLEPVPSIVAFVREVDGILQQPWPLLYITDIVIVAALTYLVLRRIIYPQTRYISLFADYFAALLILGVALSGVLMRLVFNTDLTAVKEMAMSMVTFHPAVPEGIGLAFYIHLFLVCTLMVYFPFSKLTHMAGVLLSPTRNLRNDSRMRRHTNPWDKPVEVHDYEQWEDEFREVMTKAGLPLEKE